VSGRVRAHALQVVEEDLDEVALPVELERGSGPSQFLNYCQIKIARSSERCAIDALDLRDRAF
jgi:hypothetical protein